MRLKNNRDADRIFRELAERYAQADGERLRGELEGLETAAAAYPRLDRKVGTGAKERRSRRLVLGLAAAAACLLVVLAVPVLPGLLKREQASSSQPASDTAIAFTYTLPVNLTMAGTEQDAGQTIYTLRDSGGDDVVMVLERAELPPQAEDMRTIRINGAAAYARAEADYALLLFRKHGVLYTLTCRYELDTLLELAKEIL